MSAGSLVSELLISVVGSGPYGGARVLLPDGTELACRSIEIECSLERGCEATITMRARTVDEVALPQPQASEANALEACRLVWEEFLRLKSIPEGQAFTLSPGLRAVATVLGKYRVAPVGRAITVGGEEH